MACIACACSDWGETQAVYRFFDQANNDKRPLGWEMIRTPHVARTEASMRQRRVVLCMQDTTEWNCNGQSIDVLGPLPYETQCGMYLPQTYVVTPAREPFGIADAWMRSLEAKAADGTRPGARESFCCCEGYARFGEMADTMPYNRMVYIGDRESDIVEMMLSARDSNHPADWLIRSQHNRTLQDGEKELWAHTMQSESLGGD